MKYTNVHTSFLINGLIEVKTYFKSRQTYKLTIFQKK